MDILITSAAVIISQCICFKTSSCMHKYIQCLYVYYISIKLWKFKKLKWLKRKKQFPTLPHTFWIRISNLHPPTFCLLQTLWPHANSHSWNHFPINVQQLSPPPQLHLEALLGGKMLCKVFQPRETCMAAPFLYWFTLLGWNKQGGVWIIIFPGCPRST